jgi:hypothetical protein
MNHQLEADLQQTRSADLLPKQSNQAHEQHVVDLMNEYQPLMPENGGLMAQVTTLEGHEERKSAGRIEELSRTTARFGDNW